MQIPKLREGHHSQFRARLTLTVRYRHPVRLCKASLMHAAYLTQGSQEQAGDVGILMFELTARMRRSPKEAR